VASVCAEPAIRPPSIGRYALVPVSSRGRPQDPPWPPIAVDSERRSRAVESDSSASVLARSVVEQTLDGRAALQNLGDAPGGPVLALGVRCTRLLGLRAGGVPAWR
jgi:hypothetical protein